MARRGLVGILLPLFLFLNFACGHRGMLLGGKRRADIGTDSPVDTASAYANWTPTTPAFNVFGFVHGRIGIHNEIPAFDSVVEVDNQTPGFDRRAGILAGKRKASEDDDAIVRLFNRQATCPTGTSPCSDNRNLCCPTGGSCCSDGTCCASGFSCVFQTSPSKIVCCPSGANCPGTSPCQDPGYVICPGLNFCCPSGYTCFRDSLGVGKCNPPATTSGSTGSSTTATQTGTNTSTTNTASTTVSASNSTTPSLTPTTPTTPLTTPTTPITTPTLTTNGGVSVITTSTTVAVAGAPTAESQNLTTNSTPVGAIAGGVVGGVALIALIIVAIVIIIKKRRAAEAVEELPSPTLPMDFAPQMAQFQQEDAMYATSVGSGAGAGAGAGYATSVASNNTAGVAGYGAGGYNPGGFVAPAAAAGVGAYHYQKRTSYADPNQAYGGYNESAYGGLSRPGTSPDPGPDPFRTPPPRGQALANPSPYFSNAPHLGSYGALPADQRYSGVSQDRRYSQTQRHSAQGQPATTPGYNPPQSASTNERSSYSHYNGPSTGNTASFYGGDSPNATTGFGQAR